MEQIYKYVIDPRRLSNFFWIPEQAEFLSVQTQGDENEQLCMWFKVNPGNTPERRDFIVVGTGHNIPEYATNPKFLGTCQMCKGRLVWHVFEI